VESLKKIADKLRSARKASDFKSAILPVNFPSVNKTYYQIPSWDGARLGGWVEIACKVPSLIKTLYNKAFSPLSTKLYYRNGVCRTAYIMKTFSHNILILKEKSLLFVDEKRGFSMKIPSGGAERSRTAVQTYLP